MKRLKIVRICEHAAVFFELGAIVVFLVYGPLAGFIVFLTSCTFEYFGEASFRWRPFRGVHRDNAMFTLLTTVGVYTGVKIMCVYWHQWTWADLAAVVLFPLIHFAFYQGRE